MVRSILATMVCIVMCINLNYFKPHQNHIVFWVEQAANISSTLKYLVAVVIASNDNHQDAVGSEAAVGSAAVAGSTAHQDRETMGYILVVCDIAVMAVSVVASIACFYVLHVTLTGKTHSTHPHALGMTTEKIATEVEKQTLLQPYSTAKRCTVVHPTQNHRNSDLARDRMGARLRDSEMCKLRISELKILKVKTKGSDSERRIGEVMKVKTKVQEARKLSASVRAQTREKHMRKRSKLETRLKIRKQHQSQKKIVAGCSAAG